MRAQKVARVGPATSMRPSVRSRSLTSYAEPEAPAEAPDPVPGFEVAWSARLREHFAGHPLKNVALAIARRRIRTSFSTKVRRTTPWRRCRRGGDLTHGPDHAVAPRLGQHLSGTEAAVRGG